MEVNCASWRLTEWTWIPSSRVGTRTRTRVTWDVLGLYTNRSNTGNMKAAVFPEGQKGSGTSLCQSEAECNSITCPSSSTGTQVSTQEANRNTGLLDWSRQFKAEGCDCLQGWVGLVSVHDRTPSPEQPSAAPGSAWHQRRAEASVLVPLGSV